MSKPAKLGRDADCSEHRNDPEHTHLTSECLDVGTDHYCSAQQCIVGHRQYGDLDTIVVLMMRGQTGLAWQLTPAGARDFAAAFTRAADQVEARQAARANAQLAATLARRKP